MHFHPITIADRPIFLKYFQDDRTTCDWTFANLFCWQDHYKMEWAEWESWLIIRCHLNGERRIGYMVIDIDDSHPYSEIVPLLAQEANAHGHPLMLVSFSERECGQLLSQCPDSFVLDRNRDLEDYVYSRAELAELRGRKFAPKRNHVNKFTRLYDYTYGALTRADFDECLRLESVWRGQHGDSSDGPSAEQQAIRHAFDHFEDLQLLGGVLRVDDNIVAFTYGSRLNDHTFCTHVEKADTSYDGAYAMINHLFARYLPPQYTLINREEDLGLPGLRKSKLSYMPVNMAPKILALHLTSDMRDILHVWQVCFGDEDSFVHSFLARYYFPDCAFVRRDGGHVVSMAFVIPCITELGPTAYLYGIATLPGYRGKGLAREVIHEAVTAARSCGFAAAMLIPAEPALKPYYQQFGFIDSDIPVIFTNELDLGTGDDTRNRAMVAPFSEGIVLPDEISCLASL